MHSHLPVASRCTGVPYSAGPYYLSNVLLALLSGLCIFVCSREYPSRRQEVLAHELYYLCAWLWQALDTHLNWGDSQARFQPAQADLWLWLLGLSLA